MRSRQDELETGAVRMRALVDELAAVRLRKGFRDREPEAAVAARRLIASAERRSGRRSSRPCARLRAARPWPRAAWSPIRLFVPPSA
jgi:hypothetical protein